MRQADADADGSTGPWGRRPNLSAATGYVNTSIGRTNLGILNYHTNLDGFNVDLKARDNADVEVTSGAAQPGGNPGWHYHPGPVLVLVKTGALTVYHADDPSCQGTTYTAGSTFIEGTTPHIVRNEGATTAEIIGSSSSLLEGATNRIGRPRELSLLIARRRASLSALRPRGRNVVPAWRIGAGPGGLGCRARSATRSAKGSGAAPLVSCENNLITGPRSRLFISVA